MRFSRELLLTCAVLAGCDAASPPPAVPAPTPAPAGGAGESTIEGRTRTQSAQATPHQKPTAAVELRLDVVDLGNGDHELTLVATPTRATPALDLVLDGAKVHFDAVAAGEPKTMTARVHVDGDRGREIIGSAEVGEPGRRRNRAATAWVGPPRTVTTPPVTIITMPDGSEISEVRQ